MDEQMTKQNVKAIAEQVWHEMESKEEESEKGEKMYGQESTVYSQGAGGYGYGGLGGIAPIGLFGLIGANGFGGFGGRDAALDAGISQRITDLQIAGVNQNISSAEANLTNATLMQTNSLGQLIMNAENSAINTTRTVGDVLASQTAGVKDAVQNSMFQQALFGKDFAISQCAQTNDLKNEITAQGEATRALINANTVQDLRDQLAAVQTKYDFASRGLMEANGPTVSVIQPNPCAGHSSSETDIVNAIQIGVGTGIAQGMAAIGNVK